MIVLATRMLKMLGGGGSHPAVQPGARGSLGTPTRFGMGAFYEMLDRGETPSILYSTALSIVELRLEALLLPETWPEVPCQGQVKP